MRACVLPLAIVAIAAVLRLWAIELDAQNPFYDAAVRSMGLSWHNFFFGALDPSGKLGIDKPPVDLWLQVLSTKLLGFNRAALALPETLGGIAAVALLYAAVARACGRLAGGLSALALAVMPIAVLTSRSDTMDSVMSALLVAALWSSVVAMQSRRARYILLSAALVGVAFDVKLGQALVAVPALALMWWAAFRPHRRIRLAAVTGTVLVVVAMAWALTASLTPLSGRPFPMGSHTGSIYRAMFVFNGIERLAGASREVAPFGFSSGPGLGRLLGLGQPHYATLIGLELVAALALLIAAGVLWLLDRGPDRTALAEQQALGARVVRWFVATLLVWLATAYVLFSFMGHLQPRYLEAMSPAVAAVLGIATAYLLARAQTRRAAWLCAGGLAVNAAFAAHASGASDTGAQVCLLATVVALAGLSLAPPRRLSLGARDATMPRLGVALPVVVSLALLAAPAEASIDLVEERTSDANPTGSGNQFSAYLRAHRKGARYETAATNPLAVVGLIAQDAQPVLILRSIDGVLVSVGELRQLVRERAVRFVILPHPCWPIGDRSDHQSVDRHCTPTTAWSVR
ncbi:MAG TPA: glycosyltransferase family 39 protein, partial [Solirubrobacteraceae bacterium]|nr:glycosyltransferase family 39 protein [Solirubrobacteraceae bacterium]